MTESGNVQKQSSGGVLKDMPLDELKKELGYNQGGLSGEEVQKRLEKYSFNELAEKKSNPFLKFLAYFWGPITVMIMMAALLSGILREWPDLGVILTLLVMNAAVGFREEYQACNVIEALKQKLAARARVKRDDEWATIPSRELVRGDAIRMPIGEIVPADSRLLFKHSNLQP